MLRRVAQAVDTYARDDAFSPLTGPMAELLEDSRALLAAAWSSSE